MPTILPTRGRADVSVNAYSTGVYAACPGDRPERCICSWAWNYDKKCMELKYFNAMCIPHYNHPEAQNQFRRGLASARSVNGPKHGGPRRVS